MNPTDDFTVDFNQPVKTLIDDHPDLLALLVEIGFTPLEDPILRQSIGQFVSLNRGAKIAGVSVAFICQQLIYNGYQPIGVKKNNEKEAY